MSIYGTYHYYTPISSHNKVLEDVDDQLQSNLNKAL